MLRINIKKSAIIIMIACGTTLIVLFTMLWLTGNLHFDESDVMISDLTVCSGPDPISGKPVSPDTVDTKESNNVYICGLISLDRPQKLLYYWYYEQEIIYYEKQEYKEDNYIYLPVYSDFLEKKGLYKVEIYSGRNKMGSLFFEIKADKVSVCRGTE